LLSAKLAVLRTPPTPSLQDINFTSSAYMNPLYSLHCAK